MSLEHPDRFEHRHLGPDAADRAAMLQVVKVPSLDALVDEVVPPSIRLDAPLALPPAQSEFEYLQALRTTAARNRGQSCSMTFPCVLTAIVALML